MGIVLLNLEQKFKIKSPPTEMNRSAKPFSYAGVKKDAKRICPGG